MGEEDLLDLATACAETARRAEVDLLRIAYQWAVIHDPARLDPTQTAAAGPERARQYGGDGTPQVCEFAAAELGARIGRSPFAAAALMADALDLHHRHPKLWARVEAGQVKASYARHVTSKTRHLTKAQAGFVDAAVAESATGGSPGPGSRSWSRPRSPPPTPKQPASARSRRSTATFAKKLRTEAHGMGTFMVRADLPTIDAIDAYLTAKAGTLVESMPDATDDQRRVHAVLLMVYPGATPDTDPADLLPTVQLYLHTYSGPDSQGIARLEGHGPVTEAWITRVLGPRCRFRITPVLDLAGQAPVDAYEIPDRHRQAVQLMSPADTFPFASSLSRDLQVDHTVPFDQGGASGVGNYGPMTIRHHRIKTFGRWAVQQPFPGHLPVARPPRRVLPRRPHRHPAVAWPR